MKKTVSENDRGLVQLDGSSVQKAKVLRGSIK
jgi:hypothetical protein